MRATIRFDMLSASTSRWFRGSVSGAAPAASVPSVVAPTAGWLRDAGGGSGAPSRSVTKAVRSWGLDGGSVSMIRVPLRRHAIGRLFLRCVAA